ncbi:acetyl-CoA synthetase-like protein [Dichomitus squalens]|uniref:Acetyl-CoA synthetase-like protein n=1 Tax=Dichomitus squalens TaxID=114155 RepID=A0A4Q9M8H7_9APHY|nr:acetyl-CoA synthetase-like protein [Dichomitus squalens]
MPLTAHDLPPRISSEFRIPEDLIRRDDTALPQLYDWNAKENPNYPLFLYHDPATAQNEYITYSTANEAINRAARYITHSIGREPNAPTGSPVVGILANTDTITYFCTIIGAFRAGVCAFLISTRNAAIAVADMAKRTGLTHIIVSPDAIMNEIADGAIKLLASDGVNVQKHRMPVFEDLFPATPMADSLFEKAVELPKTYDVRAYNTIMHSSGSTGHPKPIRWTIKGILSWGQEPLKCNVDIKGTIMGAHGSPMFHGLGSFLYSAAPINGFIVAAFKPASPPTVPTPDAVWTGIAATGSDFSWSVPSFIEEWGRDPEKVLYMKRMRGVIFGGAALNDQVGNTLAAQGVSLYTVYGCTEVGLINTFARPNPGMDWAYWSVTASLKGSFRPMGDGTYEVVVLSPPDLPLPVTNTKVGDQDAYATSDLAVPHPTQPGLWKIVGRADEQIILSNGEKTNPVPLEKMINEDPFVKSSVMFGRGKFQNGVLIEPTEDFQIDPTDAKQLEAYRNKIWPTIERVNEFAPQHSRIFKEMILVTHPSKPFEHNAKGLPRRGVILKEYADEIEALYKEVENSAQSEFAPPAVWDPASTLAFVRTVVQSTLRRAIADDADIFRNGGDSLQSTWIRNTLLRAIRETHKDAAVRLPMNVVFQAPTIASLATLLHNIIHSAEEAVRAPQDLWKHVEKYSANLPARPANLVERPEGQKDVVIITGTTGGFGCDTLEHLLRDETVERVYAFNRKGAQALERQRKQFEARGLDVSLLDSPKFRMVEAVLHEPGFAVEAELLDEIRTSATHILHNAWKVDFNLSIASFEHDIQGARNLVDLAISSPYKKAPTVVFVSSVGVFSGCKISPPVPEIPLDDPASAFGTGYSESKWVTEHVLQNVTERTGVHTVVMRLGQVAGDRKGYWNEREWFPSLVKSALFQKCLPEHDGKVTWFPAYEAAKAFAEMRRSPESVLHLVHPHPVPWHALLAPIAEELGVPLVPYTQWLEKLEGSVEHGSAEEVEAMKANPALRLLPFYKAQAGTMTPDREAMGLVFISTEKAVRVSESLAKMPQLGAERARMWLAAWKRSGFIQ